MTSVSLCKSNIIDFRTRKYIAIPHCSYQTALNRICEELTLKSVQPPKKDFITFSTIEGPQFLYDMTRERLFLEKPKRKKH